jgi:hypothetical protein
VWLRLRPAAQPPSLAAAPARVTRRRRQAGGVVAVNVVS